MGASGRAILGLAVMTAVSACGDSPQMAAQKNTFNTCQQSVASRNPSTCGPGELCADAKHIGDLGEGMEQCMAGFGYTYNASKAGCELPPAYDARFYFQKSKVECYAPRT